MYNCNKLEYIDIIGKVLAVDKEIDEKNVDKSIVISEKGLTIKVDLWLLLDQCELIKITKGMCDWHI